MAESGSVMGESGVVGGVRVAGAVEHPTYDGGESVELLSHSPRSVIQKVNIQKLYHKTKAGCYDI